MKKAFYGKRFLITAGPVWVPIDSVRVLTNIFGGKLGYVIAQEAVKLGAEVTLLMGPGRVQFVGNEKFKVIKYRTFSDIYKLMKNEISTKKYDVIIHSAAIPDYVPVKVFKGKIKSGKKDLTIRFKKTFKIVDRIKKWDKDVLLVKFKLEVGKSKKQLLSIAHESMLKSHADIIVANEFGDVIDGHLAYICGSGEPIKCYGKDGVAKNLLSMIRLKI